MAKCKCCHLKGFMIETDFNGLCSKCAPYYYLILPDDLKVLEKTLRALNRIDQPSAAIGRIETARNCLERLQPYAEAGLVKLPMPLADLDNYLEHLLERWLED